MKAIPNPARGSKFGRWTVLGAAGSKHGGRALQCVCECGVERVIQCQKLRSGRSQSCGCLAREQSAERAKAMAKHGMSHTAEYKTWICMRERCNNPKQKGYERYGGRGIKVCERWNEFENFLADIGTKPSPQHSIDRIDGSKDYSPENCRWATDVEQNNNREGNVVIEYQGKSQTVAQWAVETGLSWATIRYRVGKGWPAERILARGGKP